MTKYLATLEENLDLYLGKKAPSLPENWKEVIVQVAPWVTTILFVLALPVILTLFGFSMFLLPFSYVAGVGGGLIHTISMVVLGASLVFEAMAIPGLFKREKRSWRLIYHSVLLSGVSTLLNGDIGGVVIGTLLSLYILFQIKAHYR